MNRKSPPVAAVRVERVISAPPGDVYRAWLDPELLQRWMAPGSFTAERVEVDARVGGRFSVWHFEDGAHAGGFEAEILELVPDRRIVFRWGFVGPKRNDGPVYDSLLTITLNPGPRGTTALTLLHEKLDDLAAAMPDIVGSVQAGWEMVVEKLAALLRA